MEYASIESRLATFEPPTKRSKLGWPHKTPTPEALAHAGFYYKPSKSSNDNTICYLCERQLGGWEADDDPFEEHLKHSPECGWALVMTVAQDSNLDPKNMEDPTGQQFTDARRATFAIGWPHEAKRAWKCKTERMVEAGWHFTPVPEGEDYVSCAYCKLCLDGWEPKDDPFEEHHRRSPHCIFFHFAGHTPPSKRPKAKKGRASRSSRTSKASTRLSTQSSTQDVTMLSEAPSAAVDDIPPLDDSIDASEMSSTSILSMMSTASTATTKGKRKGTGGRAKTTKPKKAKTTRTTKAKKQDTEPEMEPEPMQDIAPAPTSYEPEMVPIQVLEVDTQEESEQHFQQRPSLHPLPSPPSEPTYPTLPETRTPPTISNTPRRLSPVAVQDHSPTPIKPRSIRSSMLATDAKTSTPRPPPSTARSIHNTQTRSALSTRAVSPNQTRKAVTSSPAPSPSTSDIENAPPSTRSPSSRPPAPTTTLSPTRLQAPTTTEFPGHPIPKWTPSDIEMIFTACTPAQAENETLFGLTGSQLSSPEKSMTVHEWIEFIALKAEESLRSEGERVVNIFEQEGQRAMGVLEGVTCV